MSLFPFLFVYQSFLSVLQPFILISILLPVIQKQPREVLCKKGVLKNFWNLTWKQLCWNLFSIKFQRILHGCFSVKFAKFYKHVFWRTSANDSFWSFLLVSICFMFSTFESEGYIGREIIVVFNIRTIKQMKELL